MPRPKRTKVAPSAPAPAPHTRKAPAESTTTKPVFVVPKEFDELYDISDPEDRAVKTVRRVQKSNDRGAVAVTPRGRRSEVDMQKLGHESAKSEVEEEVQSRARRYQSDIEDFGFGSSPEMEVGRRERNTPAMENSALRTGNFRRRARQPSILGRAAGRARSSSVESNLAEDNGLTGVGKTNTSSLAFGEFKRPPRQPSIIGRNINTLAPSTMVLEMEKGTPAHVRSALNLGNFKRRAREPSILGTAQKPQQPRPDYDDEDDEDEDDFNPPDESTPINFLKTKNMTSSSGTSSSNPRKRKLSLVQVPNSRTNLKCHRGEEEDEIVPATGSLNDEVEDDESSLLEEPLPMHSIEGRLESPEAMSEIMTSHQSSSSESSSPEPELPTRRPISSGRALRGRTPQPRIQDSPSSSPPSLTHSPNRPYITAKTAAKPKVKKAVLAPSTYTTTQLRSLLPRRRRRIRRNLFDVSSSGDEIDASGLASEDDELSHLAARTRRQRSVLPRTPAPASKALKPKPPPKPTAKPIKRTYSSRSIATSDKENEDEEADPDDSLAPVRDNEENPENSQELEKRVGKELKKAARKFQEVDKWELEFEECTGSSSPPGDAR